MAKKHESIDLGLYNMLGSHKAENVAERLKEIFTLFAFDTSRVSTLIADNASNMKKLAKSLNLNYFGCFAHFLNLIVNKAFSMCFSPLNDDSDEVYFEEENVVEESEESEEEEDEMGSKNKFKISISVVVV